MWIKVDVKTNISDFVRSCHKKSPLTHINLDSLVSDEALENIDSLTDITEVSDVSVSIICDGWVLLHHIWECIDQSSLTPGLAGVDWAEAATESPAPLCWAGALTTHREDSVSEEEMSAVQQWAAANDLTIGWQNSNLLSHPNATLALQARPSGEN